WMFNTERDPLDHSEASNKKEKRTLHQNRPEPLSDTGRSVVAYCPPDAADSKSLTLLVRRKVTFHADEQRDHLINYTWPRSSWSKPRPDASPLVRPAHRPRRRAEGASDQLHLAL